MKKAFLIFLSFALLLSILIIPACVPKEKKAGSNTELESRITVLETRVAEQAEAIANFSSTIKDLNNRLDSLQKQKENK